MGLERKGVDWSTCRCIPSLEPWPSPSPVCNLVFCWAGGNGLPGARTYFALSLRGPAWTRLLCLGPQVAGTPGPLCSQWLLRAPLLAAVALGGVQPSSGALSWWVWSLSSSSVAVETLPDWAVKNTEHRWVPALLALLPCHASMLDRRLGTGWRRGGFSKGGQRIPASPATCSVV